MSKKLLALCLQGVILSSWAMRDAASPSPDQQLLYAYGQGSVRLLDNNLKIKDIVTQVGTTKFKLVTILGNIPTYTPFFNEPADMSL